MSSGDLAEREIDDLGEQVLSFAEIKALATGDPRIMEKAGVDFAHQALNKVPCWHDRSSEARGNHGEELTATPEGVELTAGEDALATVAGAAGR